MKRENRDKKTSKRFSRVIHRWLGLLFAVLMLVFCVSGIILNHRKAVAKYGVSRNLMPAEYHIRNYNNGIVKGTFRLNDGELLAYGNSGIWITDHEFSKFSDFNMGLPPGPDNRAVKNMVRSKDGKIWAALQSGLYMLENDSWRIVALPENDERITDIALSPDSTTVTVMTRSAIYRQNKDGFYRVVLPDAIGYKRKVSLFKTIWMLHSGELFGTVGRIVVDLVALAIIFLCITGIIIFILPYSIRRSAKRGKPHGTRLFKWNFRWHDKIGYVTIILTILIAFTGMCLRPPLMIPFVLTKTAPLPGSELDQENAWHDRMRALRYDDTLGKWILSTSEGFYTADSDFMTSPELISNAPPVSPMGINVFEPRESGEWLVGSFSGLYIWNPAAGTITDYFTSEPYRPAPGMRPTSENLITGHSRDISGEEIIFDYSKGSSRKLPGSELLESQPISLWNFALELHVGRCYNPVLGPFSALFIFLAGGLLLTVLITGLILHLRRGSSHR